MLDKLNEVADLAQQLGLSGVRLYATKEQWRHLTLALAEADQEIEWRTVTNAVAQARDPEPGLIGRWRGIELYETQD